MAKFERGGPGGPGRPRGVKDKLAVEFLSALLEDFREHGIEAIRIARVEDPIKYCSILASLAPRDLVVEHSKMSELSDQDLNAVIEYARERRAKLIEQKPPEMITNGKDRSTIAR
jgi:hypothetical protein